MALTVTNPNSLTLLNIVNRTSTNQSMSLQRLSTGSRINSGADDPAGLITMRGLDAELTSVDAALANNQRTDAMLGVADKALGEVAVMLNDIIGLAQKSANSAGLSASEVAANQSQIDNAIAAIDRIVGSTEFNGKKLLDGSQGINTTSDPSKVTDVSVFSRNPNASSTSISVAMTDQADKAEFAISSAAATGDMSISVQGELGAAVIDITTGDTVASIQTKINDATAQTGVSAIVSSGTLSVRSTDFGSDAFARVDIVSGSGNTAENYATGDDADVTINGQTAAVDGLRVNFSSGGLDLAFELNSTWDGTGGATVTVSNQGGATFALGTDANERATLGIDSLFSQGLGKASLGYLSELKSGGAKSLTSDPTKAAEIAKAAGEQIATIQGRLGGFNKFQVKTTINALNARKEGLSSARSSIADVDYATESAELNKQNVLLQSAMSLLGLANQQSSQILSLL